jgi:hypothetical protein
MNWVEKNAGIRRFYLMVVAVMLPEGGYDLLP